MPDLNKINSLHTAIFCFLLAPFTHSAIAEPVYIESGTQIGQGWVGKWKDLCIVATAKHVVDGQNTATVIGPNQLQGEASSIIRDQGSETHNDIALLVVEGKLKMNCPPSSWGFDSSLPTLKASKQGRIKLSADKREKTNSTFESIPVEIYTIDEVEPRFTVRASVEGWNFQGQGDSGTVIVQTAAKGGSGNEPVGMVSETEILGENSEQRTIVYAIRFDRIKALLKKSFPDGTNLLDQQKQSFPFQLINEKSSRIGSECGPLNAINSVNNGCGYRAKPKDNLNPVELTLGFEAVKTLKALNIILEEGSKTNGVSVLTTDKPPNDSYTFTPIRFCQAAKGVINCSFMPHRAQGVLLRFDGEVSVKSISFQGEKENVAPKTNPEPKNIKKKPVIKRTN